MVAPRRCYRKLPFSHPKQKAGSVVGVPEVGFPHARVVQLWLLVCDAIGGSRCTVLFCWQRLQRT